MVDVFIIHSGYDYGFVKETVEPFLCGKINKDDNLTNLKCNANILTLSSGMRKNWKFEASKKIKTAQVIIVIIGADSNKKSKNQTMGWEVSKAMKYNKQIYVYNIQDYDIPEYLICVDKFTQQNKLVSEPTNLQTIKKRIDDFANGYYNIFSNQYNSLNTEQKHTYDKDLIEQYKMFQKTSEDLIARRQSVNSFYISLNTALVTFIGVILGILDKTPLNIPLNIIVMMAMCVAGIILDIAWINILDAYGTLNSAKMKVISLMEEQLPIALYDSEWMIMSDKLNNKKYVSFTNSEKKIPRTFGVIYCIVLTVCVFYLSI